MKVLKFNLSGNCATFKKPHINTVQLTYSHIHKISLLGMLGAILGYDGYKQKKIHNDKVRNSKEKNKKYIYYPEFYEKLKNIKVSIVPNQPYFGKKIRPFTDDTCFWNDNKTIIIKEQLLINPSWDIYVLLEDENIELNNELYDRLKNRKFEFEPYLGRNHFFADINNVEILEMEKYEIGDESNSIIIKSLFNIGTIPKQIYDDNKFIDIDKSEEFLEDYDGDFNFFLTNEYYPISLTPFLNFYQEERFINTNYFVHIKNNDNLYKLNDNILYFY